MSASVLRFFTFHRRAGSRWSLTCSWWLVLIRGSSISHQLSWMPLRGWHTWGHQHTQSEHKVHSGTLDICCVSGESWLAASAPAGWKLVSPSSQGVERPPGAGLPCPNASEDSLGFSLVQLERAAKTRLVLRTPPRHMKETSLHVCSCRRALLQCGGAVCKKRRTRGSAGGDYSRLARLCVVSREGALSGFLLRPDARLKSSPTRAPFLSICYKLCSSQAGLGNEPPSPGALPRPALLQERGRR